jgi:hypothetical protein
MRGGGLLRPIRPFQVLCVWAVVLLVAAVSLQFGPSERAGVRPMPDKPNLGAPGERLNTNTISIISGNPNATHLTIAYDLSAVFDDGDNFRILPMIGKGGGQNIRDVHFLAARPASGQSGDVSNAGRRSTLPGISRLAGAAASVTEVVARAL